jgi:hypothetical protein
MNDRLSEPVAALTCSDLLEHLEALETDLHRLETRQNRKRLEQLLHPDFVEFARSGRRYARRARSLRSFRRTMLPSSQLTPTSSCLWSLVPESRTSGASRARVHELYEGLGFESYGLEFRLNFGAGG